MYGRKGITMRNSKLMKIITVILSVTILVLAAIAVSAVADGTGAPIDARVTVVSKNAAYESKTQLVFAVKCDDLKENEEIYLLFWDSDPGVEGKTAKELFDSASYRKTAYEKGASVVGVDGCELISSKGIPASKINSDVYILPVIRAVDTEAQPDEYSYTVGADLFTYSVKAYAEERLADRENITGEQEELYRNIIRYGNAAEKIFSVSTEE